jgi:hypothetical protein
MPEHHADDRVVAEMAAAAACRFQEVVDLSGGGEILAPAGIDNLVRDLTLDPTACGGTLSSVANQGAGLQQS